MIKVSIIVPVYNVEHYLKKCIESIINQSLSDIEIILIDDGSTDSSGEICDSYQKIDRRIKVIHKNNEGLGLTRNSGLDIAQGEYIGFVDSDDYIDKDMYLNLYNASDQETADIVYGGYKKFINDKIIANHQLVNKKISFCGKEQITYFLFDLLATVPKEKKDSLYGATVWKGIFKRSIINNYNIKFVSERKLISEDIIWDIDYISKCSKINVIERSDYYYRTNLVSLTKIYRSDRYLLNKKLYLEMQSRLSNYNYDIKFINRLPRYFLTILRIAILQEVIFIKDNGLKKAYNNIKNICNDELVITILQQYPYKDMDMKQAIFFNCIRKKRYLYVFALAYLNIKTKEKT